MQIYKRGPKQEVSNYRPISLTSIICKIMETKIRAKIMNYLESNKLFTCHQHGFRKGKLCVTQLLEVLDDWWTENIDTQN